MRLLYENPHFQDLTYNYHLSVSLTYLFCLSWLRLGWEPKFQVPPQVLGDSYFMPDKYFLQMRKRNCNPVFAYLSLMEFPLGYYKFFELTNTSTEVIVSYFSFALYLFQSKYYQTNLYGIKYRVKQLVKRQNS